MGKVDNEVSQQSEASRMLEAALQQIDGILHGVKSEVGSSETSPVVDVPSWMRLSNTKGEAELEERLLRLEGERDALHLQVQVLGQQLAAQADKIADLTECLDDKRHQLNQAENLLQREMLSRSSLETQKLELMSTISELKLQIASLERENIELQEERRRAHQLKPPINPRHPNPFANQQDVDSSSSTNPFKYSTPNTTGIIANQSRSPSLSPVASLTNQRREFYSGHLRRSLDQFSSLPRRKLSDLELKVAAVTGKTKTPLITLKSEKSYSAPNLGPDKLVGFRGNAAELDLAVPIEITPSSADSHHAAANKGLKKIFTKLKRSSSTNVHDLAEADFRRGGIRATAAPRLGCPVIRVKEIVDIPVRQWNREQVCSWLEELGLDNYIADARRWVQNGAHLVDASPQEIEKELGLKNPLHRKKLFLALQSLQGNDKDEYLKPAGLLDTHWVMRWLDDIGLPQYKEVFLTGRVDGRVLHRLTSEDLTTLHITSVLHVASLRRGIQVLREHKMDGNCLTRRGIAGEGPPTPSDIALWTNHRVMEWLRAVDLAEYAPNLRGSGVHGALLVYEVRFTSELLASLLNIPPNKTLLRRHLITHFNELLGRDLVQTKREAESTLGYIPLTPSAKIKPSKRSQFTLKRKKSRSDLDMGDLVCPMSESGQAHSGDKDSSDPGTMKMENRVPDVCLLTENAKGSPVSLRDAKIETK